MIYAAFFISALVTAALFALAARAMFGVEHTGILIALGIIGGGLQMIVLLVWYWRYLRAAIAPREPMDDRF